ncbi:hypothetical protein [Aridibaculum aurantiacum]|uniref:hypothetical protein n=1 Tax=Aridibaculum aurantiacum TaxID=2810307 RepID=UPI001A9648AA|nr:hypothetical protein [Aridibaculum aurantiacum]
MTKTIYAFLLSLTIIACGENKQQADKGKERIDNVCDSVMQTFTNGGYSEAFDILKQNTVMSLSAIDTLKVTTANYAANAFPAYGKIRGYEFVLERKVKNTVAKRFYLLKFDNYYLKFEFTLYNNGDRWTVTTFAYDENLIELLY